MRAWKAGLALLVSAGGFAGLSVVGTMDLVSEAAASDQAAIEPEPSAVAAQPAPAAEPLELGPTEEAAEPERPPSGVEVPDLSGMTALRAFRRGRELGFVVDVRDEDGARVPASERLYMRVLEDGQSPPPGSFAEPGSTIRLVARYPRLGYAGGY